MQEINFAQCSLLSAFFRHYGIHITEPVGSVSNNCKFYSGGVRFDSRPGTLAILTDFFVILLSPSRSMPEFCLRLGHDRSIPDPLS
jgi:hypothetical protein